MSTTPDATDTAVSGGSSDKRAICVEERRTSRRNGLRVPATLIGMGWAGAHHCRTENISEDGAWVHVPADLDICLGQRCEMTIAVDRAGTPSESVYATVVRTAQLPDKPNAEIGLGLRFDQPLYL